MINKISSRQCQILQLLLKNKAGLSIDEIANTINISRNAVQQHFATLERDGYVQTGELKKTAGRPVRTFILTETGLNSFPKQYAWFSELIVSDLKNKMGAEAFKRYLQKLGTTLSQSLISRFKDMQTEEKIDELLKVMDEFGFQASSTKTTENNEYYIEACNCIYHDLAQKHEEICELDKTLISTLMDKEIEHIECMAKGDHICKFKIKHDLK